jgi:hypothetical protein
MVKAMKTIWVTISIMLLFSIWTVQATEIPTNVSIDNDPFVTTITLVDADGGNLQVWENDTRIFNCSGTVEDLDGFADIVNVNATLFRPNFN